MPDTALNVEGIFYLLNSLHDKKTPGSEEIPSRILKHCATEVAPILQVLFTHAASPFHLRYYLMIGQLPISHKL